MQTNEPFVPRSGFATVTESGLDFLNRHLTLVSIVVAVVAVALVILGPVRLVMGSQAVGGGSSASPVAVSQTTLGGLDSITRGGILNREPVPFTTIPDRPRNRLITYTVKPGDTLLGIATAFGLDRNTMFWANGDTLRGDVHMLQPGMNLAILPTDGVLHKSDETLTIQQIADKYGVEAADIIASSYNELEGYTPEMVPPWGMQIVIPGGVGEINADLWKPPVVEVADPVTGVRSSAFMPNMAGSCSANIAGSGGSGSFSTPLPGATFVQAFYPGHSGVDLAMPVGTPVLAADSGVVIFAGWVPKDWGYGQLVVLDHGNGWTTYYAHLSNVGVGCGQFVSKGGYVGNVGSTGNSSGPHLHFETRWNHTPDNPASYVGF